MTDPWVFGWAQLFALINTLAVCSGVGLAFWSVGKWRAEQIGKRQCELAEDALALMYEAQWVFDYVRSPAEFEGEGSTRTGQADESVPVRVALNHQFVPLERMNARSDYFTKVTGLYPRYKAIFGRKAAVPVEEILKVRSEIIHAARMLSHYTRSNLEGATPETVDRRRKNQEKLEEVKWKGAGEPDPIDARLAGATAKLAENVAPILQSRYRIDQ
jgi:hypothetical protein